MHKVKWKGILSAKCRRKHFWKSETKAPSAKSCWAIRPKRMRWIHKRTKSWQVIISPQNSSIAASVISTLNLFIRRCTTSGRRWQHGVSGSNHRRWTILQFGQRFRCISNGRWSIQEAARVAADFARSNSCLLHISEAVDLRRKWTLHRYRGYYSSIEWCDLCIRYGKSTSNQMTQKSGVKQLIRSPGLFPYPIHVVGPLRRRLCLVYIPAGLGQKQSQRDADVEP